MSMFDTALEDAIKDKAAAAKALLIKAQKKLEAGDAIGSKGDKLLGISTND